MSYYCERCHKTINHKSKSRHIKTKRHYFMKTYVTNTYNYSDIVWDYDEQMLHENIISHNKIFIEFKIYVSCKINDDVEIEVYKDELELCVVLHTFLGVNTLDVHVASKMICNIIRENLCSRCDINCTPDMKIENLTIKFVSRYGNMAYRYYMQQPRPMIESKMVKHIKYMSEEEKNFKCDLLTYKHDLNVLDSSLSNKSLISC